MRFFSDSAAPAHPAVIEAVARTASRDRGLSDDALAAKLDAAFSELFEAECTALCIPSGTASNAVALATLCPPYRGIVCHESAHIQTDECGAPEFYTGGAKLLLARGAGAKLTPDSLVTLVDAIPHDLRRVQPTAISITNATEYGQSYTSMEVAAIGEIARSRGLRLHMDGARFANAVAHTGAAPADLSWRSGVDLLSFGFIKNGGLSAEALICFDKDLAAEALLRQKRGGHVLAKGGALTAQILALLEDDRWLANARAANAGAARLAEAAGDRLLLPVEANEVFLRATAAEAAALRAKGFGFYDWADGEIRLVVSWDQPDAEVATLAQALRTL